MKSAFALGVLAVIGVGVLFVLELRQVSPGPIHSVHRQHAKIEDGACSTCHGVGGHDMLRACLECHASITAQIESTTGLHGGLDSGDVEDCGRCHPDHHGDAVPLVSTRAFVKAGFPSVEAYRAVHDRFSLVGMHADVACVDCHENSTATMIPAGDKRYTGASSACASCHDDVHHGEYGASCAECHSVAEPFGSAVRFDHDRVFPLEGRHSTVACQDCHVPATERSIRALRTRPNPKDPTAWSCVDCHDNAHAESGASIPLPFAEDCSRCHSVDAQFAAARNFDHDRVFPLLGSHATASCRSCHAVGTALDLRGASSTARAHEPRTWACIECHASPHGPGGSSIALDRFDDCAQCHGLDTFRPATVDTVDHASFGTELTGSHLRLDCSSCHSRPGEIEASRRTTLLRAAMALGGHEQPVEEGMCASCHQSPHTSAFTTRVNATSTFDARQPCAPCHRTAHTGFGHPDASISDTIHAALGFPDTTPHVDLPCSSCHDPHPDASYAARFPGRDAERCESCHANPHPDFSDETFAGSACVECHHRDRFQPARFDVPLHARTGFPLDGAHAAVPCTACHDGTLASGVPAFSGRNDACSACHDDAHYGAFTAQTCDACHSTESFRPATRPFDHSTTGFTLTGKHGSIGCASCHSTPSGRRRAVRSTCTSCHTDPHAGQFEASCERCHDPVRAFDNLRFDHQLNTRFPLDADHSKLDCNQCHRTYTFDDGTRVTRYRPLGTECQDCHGNARTERPR